jgi:hypothetical protein
LRQQGYNGRDVQSQFAGVRGEQLPLPNIISVKPGFGTETSRRTLTTAGLMLVQAGIRAILQGYFDQNRS